MCFEIWLYDNGKLKSCRYFKADSFEMLLKYLELFSENGKYTYTLINGSNSRVRKRGDIMNDLQLYVKCVMNVLQGLKGECEKHEHCGSCNLENKNEGICFFRCCPCDYELQAIETRITEIIQGEMEKGENHD